MNSLILLVATGAFFALLALFVKEQKREYGILLSVVAVILFLSAVLKDVQPVITYAKELFEKSGAKLESFEILTKVTATAILTEICVGICRDCNENALSVKVEMCGRLAMLVFSMPLFKAVFEIITSI
ncbi:MAG: hypothetical protein E7480_01960 [Ruminococcaceae bacterium]|nr:hypothetical protein [Oscillospiraceae bacterium]